MFSVKSTKLDQKKKNVPRRGAYYYQLPDLHNITNSDHVRICLRTGETIIHHKQGWDLNALKNIKNALRKIT